MQNKISGLIPRQFKNIKEVEVAINAAMAAGRIIASSYGRVSGVEAKSVGDFVSETDKLADKAITSKLRKKFPKVSIISEELNPDSLESSDCCWIVDPLDATSAFLFGQGSQSSVLIAYRENQDTKLAVVYFPLSKTVYCAVKGKGAYCNGRRLDSTAKPKSLGQSWVNLNHYSNEAYETKNFKKINKALRSSRGAALVTTLAPYSGISAKIADPKEKIAAVIHDNSSKCIKQAIWDVLAPQLILEEAGGVFLDASGKRYDPNKPGLIVAASSRRLADEILGLLA